MLTIPKMLDTPEFDKSRFIGGCLLDGQNLVLATVSKDAEFMSFYSKLNFCNIATPDSPVFSALGNGNWLDTMIRYTSAEEQFDGFCCLSPEGQVLFVQNGKIVRKEVIKEAERWGLLKNITVIAGKLYTCGSKGQIYQRIEEGNWQHIDNSILSSEDRKRGVIERKKMRDEVINSIPEAERTMENITRALDERKKQEVKKEHINLSEIHGCNDNDIYVCGTATASKEGGTVFHFNGEEWKRLPVPITRGLLSIYIYDNDTVYIGGHEGYLLKGNHKDGFVRVENDNIVSIDRFVAIAGRTYLSSNLGLRQLKDDKIIAVDIYDILHEVAPILLVDNVRIDSYNDNLLIIGKETACCYSFETNEIKFLLSSAK